MLFNIIFCAWQTRDYLPESLTPWINARRDQLGGHQYRIIAVSVPFVGFDHSDKPDGTREYLQAALERGEINHIINGDLPRTETVARGAALNWVWQRKEPGDAIWLVDSDEVYSSGNIEGAIQFVQSTPLVTWYRLSLHNAVFDKTTFLKEPFTPPRIFCLHAPGHNYSAHSFYDDNNVTYGGNITRDLIRDTEFASATIPMYAAYPIHWTWLSDSRGRLKEKYQREGRNWECSFRWDETANELRFNEAYYARRGLPLPETETITNA